jgi:hypothetical protein
MEDLEKRNRIADEVRQIAEQYRQEVSASRGAWPKSIRQRVCELKAMGVSGKELSELTGVSQPVISNWTRLRGAPKKAPSFIPVSVNSTEKSLTEKSVVQLNKRSSGLLEVELPGGILVRNIDLNTLVELSRRLVR